MTPETLHQAWTRYARAWTDITAAHRGQLLARTLTEDVTYTTPDTTGCGRDDFAAMLKAFQRDYPGAYFDTDGLLEQHGQSVADWTMRDRAGASLLTGRTYARWNDRGLIEHLAGFWASPPGAP